MSIIAEMNSVEFYQTKNQLASGYYRVIEHDGDVNIAQVQAAHIRGYADVTWFSEDEYLEHKRWDDELSRDWDTNENSELYDSLVYGVDPQDEEDFNHNRKVAIVNRGIFDGVDYSLVSDAEHAELLKSVGEA